MAAGRLMPISQRASLVAAAARRVSCLGRLVRRVPRARSMVYIWAANGSGFLILL